MLSPRIGAESLGLVLEPLLAHTLIRIRPAVGALKRPWDACVDSLQALGWESVVEGVASDARKEAKRDLRARVRESYARK